MKPHARYVVAIGFFDPRTKPGKRIEHVVLDGRRVDTLDPAAQAKGQPVVKKYEAVDSNGDGWLEVSVVHAGEEVDDIGMMNVLWVFADVKPEQIDAEKLSRGQCEIPPIYYVRCGREEPLEGHVSYPELAPAARVKMLSMRPIPLDRDPNWPQPPDPLDIRVRGDLADRLDAFLDRWGYCGRDQKLPAGFLNDSGYEVAGRYLETLYMLGRLTRRDFHLEEPFEALLAKQDAKSRHPGSFVGGDPLRTGLHLEPGNDSQRADGLPRDDRRSARTQRRRAPRSMVRQLSRQRGSCGGQLLRAKASSPAKERPLAISARASWSRWSGYTGDTRIPNTWQKLGAWRN